uniref:Uncharacterized protein n=1 Tax=Aegilops tauschii subsp. strangulata TaxID=200361 RepID=A0A453PYP9_AEGTS
PKSRAKTFPSLPRCSSKSLPPPLPKQSPFLRLPNHRRSPEGPF